MFRALVLLLTTIVVWCTTSVLQCYAQDVQFITENLAPLAFKEDQKLVGYDVELLALVWKRMGQPPKNIKVQPWARSITTFESETPTCIFPVALTAARKRQSRYVATPALFEPVLIAHKDDAPHIMRSKKKLLTTPICVPAYSSYIQTLYTYGFRRHYMDFSASLISSVRKFKKRRAPLMGGSKTILLYNYKQLGGLTSDLEVVWSAPHISGGFLFNHAVSDEYVQRFKKALDYVRTTKAHTKIFNKYLHYPLSK